MGKGSLERLVLRLYCSGLVRTAGHGIVHFYTRSTFTPDVTHCVGVDTRYPCGTLLSLRKVMT